MPKIAVSKTDVAEACRRTVGVFSAALIVTLPLSACGGGGSGDAEGVETAQSLSGSAQSAFDTPGLAAGLDATALTSPITAAQAQSVAETCESISQPPVPTPGAILVTDFGATPDDEDDDTPALQAAIDAAKSGDWVVFPPGRYIHNKSLVVRRAGVTLFGDGATLHASNASDQAIMLKADGGRVYGFTLTAVTEGRKGEAWTSRISVYGPEASGGYIKDIIVQNNRIVPVELTAGTSLSNGASAAGILVVAARNFTISGNTVRRSLSDGIHVTQGSRNGRIINNQVLETGDDMIAIVSYMSTQWRTNVKASPSWLSGHQDKTLVQNVLIANNTVSDQYWGRGVSVVGGKNITVKQNNISRSAMAAGVLIAREEGYSTHGVTNVLVDGNTIRDIQTQSPNYMPTGSYFNTLSALTSTNGGKTGQGGVEVHNISPSSDLVDAELAGAVYISRVAIRSNVIDNVWRDGIRVGADSYPNSIGVVRLTDNIMSNARSAAITEKLRDGSSSPLQCKGNTYGGVAYSIAACQPLFNENEVTGAALDCSAF